MGIAHKADRAHRCTFEVWDGDIDEREVRAHLFRLAEDPDWPPGPLNLADLSTMGEVAIPDPELVALLHEGTVLETGLKTALVVRPERLAMNARQFDGTARRDRRDRVHGRWHGVGAPRDTRGDHPAVHRPAQTIALNCLERTTGIEPATSTLARLRSTN